MNKYFYVPVTSRNIKVNGVSLIDVTGTVDFLLKDRELHRVEMLYGDKSIDSSSLEMKQDLSQYNSFTSLIFRDRCLPERLVLVQNEQGLRELSTNTVVEADENYLKCFEVQGEDVVSIFCEVANYSDLAYNYFSIYQYKMKQKNKNYIKK